MRLIKMFGFAALVAIAAMALVGATSAMAESTAICEGSDPGGSTCPGSEASHLHFATSSSEPALILSSIVNVACQVLYLGNTLGLGAPLIIHGNFTYSKCETESGGACTATELSSSALIEFLKNGSEKAEVTYNAEVLVECGALIHCVYNGAGQKWVGVGSLGTDNMSETKTTLNKVSGFLCPKTASLDIWLGALTKLYIRN
jgi:hypothetical protein